jgi:dTDP-4-dehydrorhamnose 3,5-epimerase
MTTITPLAIPDVLLITPKRHGDARGWFAETWSARRLAGTVADTTFVQDNQAFSAAKGTLRGLHFQTAPNAQGKLIRALRGAIFDVAVDIRAGSPPTASGSAPTDGRGRRAALGAPRLRPRLLHDHRRLRDLLQGRRPYAPQSEGGIAGTTPTWPSPGRWTASPCCRPRTPSCRA